MLIVLDAIEPNAIDVDAGEIDVQVIEQATFDESALASMGGAKRWKVHRIIPFISATGEQILHASVHPVDSPLPEVWYCDESFAEYPNQAIEIPLTPEGQPIQFIDNLGFFNPPQVGQLIPNFAPTDHPTLMQEATPEWQITDVEVFEPVKPGPYRSISLLRCMKVEMTMAA